MTLRLILTRHAKSSWDDPLQSDHDRVLNDRGRQSAAAIGGWLARFGYVADQVLCSTAQRTRETWDLVSKELPTAPHAEYLGTLYLAEPDQMLSALQGATGQTVMMIAHNPGAAFVAEGLAQNPPEDGRFHRYPTGATTVLDFDADSWSDVTWNSGRVVDFIVPRDLA